MSHTKYFVDNIDALKKDMEYELQTHEYSGDEVYIKETVDALIREYELVIKHLKEEKNG